ncbi:alpha/beta fold hydrolase [Roseisolibacter sp. H3M3-2]|uniref:alpha/beta fold hydrolase n=1 Tax=Roseisolibacter sp. H3M3-2 TaxID=3031323 RepID=UPI0023D9FC85|nr:alpha/beta fold hydrolase [Roseisolibacter sp. H3M3-2]MDF1503655.1 alpha/beta fold hydrolase [Roseisolibacter sp. H3M3-2]
MTVTALDHTIATPHGALFSRTWAPADARAGAAPVLLFHDSLGSVELWRDFPAALAVATGRTVVAYDRLGFGRSDPHPGTLPPTFVADEVDAGVAPVRAALGLARVVAFGHSVGGGMAVATAARLGDACEALVTVSAQSFVEDRTLAGVRAARAAFRAPGQVERLARYHGDKARWVLDAWTETWLAPSFAGWSLDDVLRDVRCQTLALHGDGDEYGSVAHPRRIAAGVRGPSRVVILDGVGHVPHREAPARVLDEVGRTLGAPAARPAAPATAAAAPSA